MGAYEMVAMEMAKLIVRGAGPWLYRKGKWAMFDWIFGRSEEKAVKRVMDFASSYPDDRLVLVDFTHTSAPLMAPSGQIASVPLSLRIASTSPFDIRPIMLNCTASIWHGGTIVMSKRFGDLHLAGSSLKSGEVHLEEMTLDSTWSSSSAPRSGEAVLLECSGIVRVHGPWPIGAAKDVAFSTCGYVRAADY